MPFRTWVFIVAFGLSALPSLGQPQEEGEAGEDRSTDQQEPTQQDPRGLPVRIIESDESAQSRQRSEAEAAQREKDDLVAQQGMNTATQAMNEATQRMALYSLISTALVGLGTALLLWTLFLTRQANNAAREAVSETARIGEAQVRAYVGFLGGTVVLQEHEGSGYGLHPVVTLSFKNYGSSPARSFRTGVSVSYPFLENKAFRGHADPPPTSWGNHISPQETIQNSTKIMPAHLTEVERSIFCRDTLHVSINVFTLFQDVFDLEIRDELNFAAQFEPGQVGVIKPLAAIPLDRITQESIAENAKILAGMASKGENEN